MSLVKSTCWILPLSCATCAAACMPAISWSSLGAQVAHRPRSSFQQTSRHTHWPQRWHCMKWGFISSTALASALSREEPRTPSRSHSASQPSSLALSPIEPPSRSPPIASRRPPNPVTECWNEEEYPLPHRRQKNSNWYPSRVLLSV